MLATLLNNSICHRASSTIEGTFDLISKVNTLGISYKQSAQLGPLWSLGNEGNLDKPGLATKQA